MLKRGSCEASIWSASNAWEGEPVKLGVGEALKLGVGEAVKLGVGEPVKLGENLLL